MIARWRDDRRVNRLSTHRDMTEAFPDAVYLGMDRLVWLLEVDRVRIRHPARSASDPEYFCPIPFGIKEVTADSAPVVGDHIDTITFSN